MKLVGRVAATSLPVLISGESGTGKELVARAIHLRSTRAAGSFVAINCGAIPADLIESELFGHIRGSFTGAMSDRQGLWQEAEGGTIFLDEITETTRQFQVKLLRALQEGEIRRIGSNHTKRVEVRVIAASNRDIEEDVRDGRFRQDLFYRLNAVTLHLPPLRDRREDIRPLAKHFARSVVARANTRSAFRRKPLICWKATTGPATFANWKTRSFARPRFAITPCARRICRNEFGISPAAFWKPPVTISRRLTVR